MKILVVDDESEIVSFLSFVLEKEGIATLGLSSPLEAIEATERETFDAIITDFKMPKMNGLEMIARIKAGNLNRNTPIIVLSGNLTNDLLDRLQRIGIIDVMSKPPELDILLRIVEKAGKLRPKVLQNGYADVLVKAFSSGFQTVMENHLGHLHKGAPVFFEEPVGFQAECTGVVSMFGRRLAGALSITYQTGFSNAFASTLLGKTPTKAELDIFDTTSGEIAEQIAKASLESLSRDSGLHLLSSPAVVVPVVEPGRKVDLPVPQTQPRVAFAIEHGGKYCILELALVDLSQALNGLADAELSNLVGVI